MRAYLGVAVLIIATAAWIVGFWAITETMKKSRDAGYRYWAINPLAMLHGLRSKEFVVFLFAAAVGAAAVAVSFLFLSP